MAIGRTVVGAAHRWICGRPDLARFRPVYFTLLLMMVPILVKTVLTVV